MKRNDFEKMFYDIAKVFPYEFVEDAKRLAMQDKSYFPKLYHKCNAFANRNQISIHDALYHYFSNGKILPTE